MRIRLISRSTPLHALGGMERVVLDIAKEWVRSGHEVSILTTPLPRGTSQRTIEGVRLEVADGRSGKSTRAWRQRVALWDHSDVDLIMGVSSGSKELLRDRRPSAPVVMQAHGTSWDEIVTKLKVRSPRSMAKLPRNVWWLGIDLRDYRRYDAVVAVGPSVTKSIKRLPWFCRPREFREIPNGVPLPPSQPRGDRSGVLFVGRLHPEKGADVALQAVVGTDLSLTICGEGPASTALGQLAETLGVTSQVQFLGRQTPTEVQRLMRTASAVVAPTRRSEGLPLVALEALVAGTPVIASPRLAKSFGDEQPLGMFVAQSVNDMRHLMLYLSREGTVDPMLIAAHAARFDLRRTGREYIRLFEDLIAGSHA